MTTTLPASNMLNLPQNMGQMDRIIRSAIGGALLANGLFRPTSMLYRLGGLIGGAFIFYGITGYDPLLQAADTTTLPEDTNNLMNKVTRPEDTSKTQTPEEASKLQVGGV